MNDKRFFLVGVALVMLLGLVLAVQPATAGSVAADVEGGGTAIITDPAGVHYPIQFAMNGQLASDGSAQGSYELFATGRFADVWGAIPGVSAKFQLTGKFTSGSLINGTLKLDGTLDETDWAQGGAVIFVEKNIPFEIVAGGGIPKHTFTFQFCQVPLMPIKTSSLEIDSHGLGNTSAATATGMQARAVQLMSTALGRPCS